MITSSYKTDGEIFGFDLDGVAKLVTKFESPVIHVDTKGMVDANDYIEGIREALGRRNVQTEILGREDTRYSLAVRVVGGSQNA